MKDCPNCGTQLSDNPNFCSNCGYNILEERPQEERFRGRLKQLWPSKTNFKYLVSFNHHNLLLVTLSYWLLFSLFFIGVPSLARWAVILVGGTLYCLGIIHQGRTLPVNISLRKFYQGFGKDKIERRNNQVPDFEEMEDSLKQNVLTAKRITPATIGLLFFSGVSLYGVLGWGFIRHSTISLFQYISTASQTWNYFENTWPVFGERNAVVSNLVALLVLYGLVLIPLVIALFALTQSSRGKIFSVLLSLIEVAFFIFLGNKVVETVSGFGGRYTNSLFTSLIHLSNGVLGFAAYALLIGAIGMVICTFVIVFQELEA
ncbi:MAG: zinc ribbon domain-containing protein [Enterococcus sp.]